MNLLAFSFVLGVFTVARAKNSCLKAVRVPKFSTLNWYKILIRFSPQCHAIHDLFPTQLSFPSDPTYTLLPQHSLDRSRDIPCGGGQEMACGLEFAGAERPVAFSLGRADGVERVSWVRWGEVVDRMALG